MKFRNCFRGFARKGAVHGNLETGRNLSGQQHPEIIDVTQLGNCESARIVELRGGGKMAGKLAALGLVPGATIKRKCASPMHGPLVLEQGLSQFAIGYGMARRVMVKRVAIDQHGDT